MLPLHMLPSSMAVLLLGAVMVTAQQFPATVEFDMVFPRENETYAPATSFPLVFAVQNAAVAWPAQFHLEAHLLTVGPNGDKSGTDLDVFTLPTNNGTGDDTSGPSPSDPYIFIVSTDLTNGTTSKTEYLIDWFVSFDKNCTKKTNTSEPSLSYGESFYGISFFTASDAPAADIVSAVHSCSTNTRSLTLAIDGFTQSMTGSQCPLLAPGAFPEANPCALQTMADTIATNVSTYMLGQLGCKSGTWQNATVCSGGASLATGDGGRWPLLTTLFGLVVIGMLY